MKQHQYSPIIVYGALILAMFFWGFSYVCSTIVFKYWTPITAIFIRSVCCSVILFSALKITKKLEIIKRKDFGLLLLSGSLCPFLYFIFEGYGLLYSTPTICSVIVSTIPIFSAIGAFLMFHEKLSTINKIGMFVSFVGVLFIVVNKDYSLAAQPIGLLFLTLCVLSSVGHILVLNKLCSKYNPFTIVAYEDLVGALLFMPLFFIFDFKTFIHIPLNSELVVMMLMLIIFAGSLAFPFHAFGLREIGVSRSNVFTNIIPAFTAVASFLFLNETFTWVKIIGIALVIGGVTLVQLRNQLKKHHS
ncbi:MAG: DMT family transporter [Bacteroidales bacterium]|nr:DMT family transporter [Bacteroidales bacterium]